MANITENGEYTIEVTLKGGSGRASIKSPTLLTVENGQMQAEIEWSSSYYDYMEIGGKGYSPINQDGNSRFLVDVPSLDSDIEMQAETLAMSSPHMIDYTLYFDSATVKKAGGNNNMAVVIGGSVVAVAILAAAGAALWKRKWAK